MNTTRRRGAAPLKVLLRLYAAALLGSWLAMGWTPAEHAVAAGMSTVELPEVGGDGEIRDTAREVHPLRQCGGSSHLHLLRLPGRRRAACDG